MVKSIIGKSESHVGVKSNEWTKGKKKPTDAETDPLYHKNTVSTEIRILQVK